jgi:hypothetical protein
LGTPFVSWKCIIIEGKLCQYLHCKQWRAAGKWKWCGEREKGSDGARGRFREVSQVSRNDFRHFLISIQKLQRMNEEMNYSKKEKGIPRDSEYNIVP